MIILAISTNEDSLKCLCRFMSSKNMFEHCDSLLIHTNKGFMKDAVKVLQDSRDFSKYDMLIFSDMDRDQELAAGIAVKLQTSCLSKCTDISLDNDVLNVKREVFGGLSHLSLSIKNKPCVITFSDAVLKNNNEDLIIEPETLEVNAYCSNTKLLSEKKILKTVDLTTADKIVSIGRGIGKKEDLEIVQNLAKCFGAEIGCSRPLSEDYKWLPIERQVGLTGETVKPKLYIAIGISGQVQHVVGMRDSQVVVAINNNKSAPIFEYCDYGLVGDLFAIVPALSKMLNEKV